MTIKIFSGIIVTVVCSIIFKFSQFIFFEKILIPLWVFILLILPVIILVIISFKKFKSPKYHKYTEDVFDGIRWRWNYYFTGDKSDPVAYCIKDDMQMVYTEFPNKTTWQCELCNESFVFDGGVLYNKNRIKRLIDREIRNNFS